MAARITGRYEYRDENGKLMYWKERIEPGRNGTKKEFRFYHGKKVLGRGGDPILYRLPDVIKSKSVVITEGEKQADLVRKWGLCATSLDSGAGSRLTDKMVHYLTDKRIAILQDNDEPGLSYALRIANALKGKFESLKIVLLNGLPDKGDICDWNGDRCDLICSIVAAPEWIPEPIPEKIEIKSANRNNDNNQITVEMIDRAKQYPIENLIEFQGGKALCFNHSEKTPSMTMFKNKCHCHGACGRSWSVIDVCMERDDMTFVEAVKYLNSL